MEIIGHRGAASIAPENTWAGIQAALEIGVDAVEVDIRCTSDGELVLFHDESLSRITTENGMLSDTNWNDISHLDAGSWFDKKFKNCKIPLLSETLTKFGRKTRFVLELKQSGIELKVVNLIQNLDLLERVTFTSFDFSIMKKVKEIEKFSTTGLLIKEIEKDSIEKAVNARMDQICPPIKEISRDFVNSCKTKGLIVRVWGVKNDVNLMSYAINLDVDGMTVDNPQLLINLLQQQ